MNSRFEAELRNTSEDNYEKKKIELLKITMKTFEIFKTSDDRAIRAGVKALQ